MKKPSRHDVYKQVEVTRVDLVEQALKDFFIIDRARIDWFMSVREIVDVLQAQRLREVHPREIEKLLSETLTRLHVKKHRQGKRKITGYLGLKFHPGANLTPAGRSMNLEELKRSRPDIFGYEVDADTLDGGRVDNERES